MKMEGIGEKGKRGGEGLNKGERGRERENLNKVNPRRDRKWGER